MMKEKVERALEKVRPLLQMDGGDVELVGIEDGIVSVRLSGACSGSAMSQVTLSQGVEEAIREEVPEIKKVVAV